LPRYPLPLRVLVLLLALPLRILVPFRPCPLPFRLRESHPRHPLLVALRVLVLVLVALRVLAPVPVQALPLPQAKLTYRTSALHKEPWRTLSVNAVRCLLK
jgi:hypothetical protein